MVVCAICQDNILPDASVSQLSCNHQYHQACLQPWLENHNICPLDREKITSINGTPVNLNDSNISSFLSSQEDLLLHVRFLLVTARCSLSALSPGRDISNLSLHSENPIAQMVAELEIEEANIRVHKVAIPPISRMYNTPARSLSGQLGGAITNPSIHSADPVEPNAARVSEAAFRAFLGLRS